MRSIPLLVLLAACRPTPTQADAASSQTAAFFSDDERSLANAVTDAELVVTATVTAIDECVSLEIDPPVDLCKYTFDKVTSERGVVEKLSKITLGKVAASGEAITIGERYLLAGHSVSPAIGGEPAFVQITRAYPLTASRQRVARSLARYPLGTRWLRDTPKPPRTSSKTRGRNWDVKDIKFEVTQVAPLLPVQWKNPYGDGRFHIRIVNTSDSPRVVPGLWATDGGRTISWKESLVVFPHEQKAVEGATVPGAATIPESADWVVLAPHDALETEVDLLALETPRWGGTRLSYTLSLGRLGATSFFYYADALHGPMRDAQRRTLHMSP